MKIPKLAVLLGGLIAASATAQEFANIEYLCCDWGPAMKLATKEGGKPQFSETEEEVYFLKQLGTFTRGVSGNQGHGINIYLCKMKPDGTGKTEIKELWHDVRYPIDTQAQSSWMDVNVKTKRIVLSVTFAGSELTGLWTLNLDGSELKRIIAPERKEKALQAIDGPSWTPDGQWIVFAESLRGTERSRIAKCDQHGTNQLYLTEGPVNCQPRVSPDGRQIAYVVISTTQGGLWIMNLDGSEAHPVPNPADKRKGRHAGIYPAWSPDGKRIYGISMGIIDAGVGQMVLDREPMLQGRQSTCGWSHWGRLGFVGFNVGGIKITDSELRQAKWIGSSKTVECSGNEGSCRW